MRPRFGKILVFLFALLTPALAQTYPPPEQVENDITDPAKRVAALYVLAKAVNNHGLSQEAANKYMAAQDRLDPPFPMEKHQAFVKEWYPLTQNPAFVDAVVRKYLPYLAPTVHGELVEQVQARQQDQLTEKIHRAGTLLFYTMLGVPLLFLAWPWRVKGHKPKMPDEAVGFLRFPEELRRVQVFRKSYPLAYECGQIFEVNEWVETHTSTTTHPGRTYTIGNTTYQEPSTTSTHTTSTQWHRYWFNRPDGQKSYAKFSNNVFLANRGNIISTIDAGGYIFYAYNHTTGNFLPQKWCWTVANRYPGRWIWLATVLAIGAVTYALKGYLADDYHREMPGNWWTSVGMAMIVFAVVAPVYIYVVKFVVQFIRNFQFKRKYEPAIRRFLEQSTPTLQNMYPGMPPEQPKMGVI